MERHSDDRWLRAVACFAALTILACGSPGPEPRIEPPPPSEPPAAPAAPPATSPTGVPLAETPPAKAAPPAPPAELVSVLVAQAPKVDGKAGDAAWKSARGLDLQTEGVFGDRKGTKVRVTLLAVHTKTRLYLQAVWDDATQDVSHKSWRWNAESKVYEEGKDREDMFAVAFEHTGEFVADMLAPVEATWDVWHWKAFRTNPQGYAMDKAHHYSKQETPKAKKHPGRDGQPIYVSRPEDAGDSVEKKAAAPKERRGDELPQYRPGRPTGSAADVRAKGAWADGKWTLELERTLTTGHEDDTQFDLSRSYSIAVATFDRTGDMDRGSPLIRLRFEQAPLAK